MRQRREVLDRQIRDAQRPRGFGRSPSASLGSPQPSLASSLLASRSSRRISFDGASSAAAPGDGHRWQSSAAESARPATAAGVGDGPTAAASSQEDPVQGQSSASGDRQQGQRAAPAEPPARATGAGPAEAALSALNNGPYASQRAEVLTSHKSRSRPWLSSQA